MTKRIKQVLIICLIFALCVCNLSFKAITSEAAGKKVTAITLNTTTKTLTEGQTYQLKVKKVKPANAGKSVTWKSSNSKVVKVNSKGKVTAKKTGKVTITATSKANKKVKATCKITVYSKVKNISLNYNSKEIKEGESFQLKTTISPKTAIQKVTYSSSNPKIATVTKDGKVSGKKAGKATITVTSQSNKAKKAKCVVRIVTSPKASLAPSATEVPSVTKAPTATEVPSVTEAPAGDGDYTKLSGPRTDAEGNITYDCVYFGNYPQSDATGETKDPIKWRILSINGTDAFLVADQNLDVYRYNEKWTDVTWETSTIRSWLNGYDSEANACDKDYSSDNFINRAFTSEEQAAIPYVSVVNEDNYEYGTEGGNDTLDKIYLLSVSEVSNASYGFLPYKDENNVVIYDKARERTDTAYVAAGSNSGLNGYVDSWWLRSPSLHSYEAAVVYGNGNVGGIIVSASRYTVCPALHLNLSATNVWSNAETVTVYR